LLQSVHPAKSQVRMMPSVVDRASTHTATRRAGPAPPAPPTADRRPSAQGRTQSTLGNDRRVDPRENFCCSAAASASPAAMRDNSARRSADPGQAWMPYSVSALQWGLLAAIDRRAVALIVLPAFVVQVIVGIFAFGAGTASRPR
jgi:hypothetical protein